MFSRKLFFSVISGLLVFILALVAALGISQWQLDKKHAEIKRLSASNENLISDLNTATTSVIQLTNLQKKIIQQRIDQEQALVELTQQAEQLTEALRDTKANNPHYPHWATQPVPALISRLHEHNTLTSASDYRQYLHRTGTLSVPIRASD